MTTNFTIDDIIALKHEGYYLDLHNNFDLNSFEYRVKSREFILSFEKGVGDWIKEDEKKGFRLLHTNVSYYLIDTKDSDSNPKDDTCISEISFYPSDSRDENSSIIPQESPKEKDDIIYFFESGQYIRIGCEKIELTYK